jgi:hypothetical protein
MSISESDWLHTKYQGEKGKEPVLKVDAETGEAVLVPVDPKSRPFVRKDYTLTDIIDALKASGLTVDEKSQDGMKPRSGWQFFCDGYSGNSAAFASLVEDFQKQIKNGQPLKPSPEALEASKGAGKPDMFLFWRERDHRPWIYVSPDDKGVMTFRLYPDFKTLMATAPESLQVMAKMLDRVKRGAGFDEIEEQVSLKRNMLRDLKGYRAANPFDL